MLIQPVLAIPVGQTCQLPLTHHGYGHLPDIDFRFPAPLPAAIVSESASLRGEGEVYIRPVVKRQCGFVGHFRHSNDSPGRADKNVC